MDHLQSHIYQDYLDHYFDKSSFPPEEDIVVLPFHEVQFPSDISVGTSGGPRFNTGIICTASGAEQRTQNWRNPTYAFNVTHAVRSQTQLNELISFFRARKGKTTGFRFKDWTDYKIVNGPLLRGNGSTNMNGLQITKYYIDIAPAYYTARKIKKPVIGTVKLYIDDVEIDPLNYSVNYTTGIITCDYVLPDQQLLTIDCEFDVPVRFDTDEMPASIDDWDSYSWSGITLVEVKLV